MKRQAIWLMTMVATTIVALTACGGASNAPEDQSTTSGGSETTTASGEPYNADPTLTSLREASWEVDKLEEPQDTYTVPDIGYLEAGASQSDGETIDLEFFKSPEEAQAELEETKRQEAPFEGTTIGNVLVFDPESETAAVSEVNIQALQGLLK
jgi:hypothetical protein